MKSFKNFTLTEANLTYDSVNRNAIYQANIVDQIKNNEPFELVKGGTITLKNDAATIKELESGDLPKGYKLPDVDGTLIPISRLLKTTKIKGSGAKLSNKGDVAEGILAAALYMKFAGLAMNEDILNKIITSQVKLKTDLIIKSKSTPSDDVILFINLGKNHFDSLTNNTDEFRLLRKELVMGALDYAGAKNVARYNKYFNNNQKNDTIKIIADGLGGQRDTKADLLVEWTSTNSLTGEETTRNLNLNLSLKVGDTKQFGQVSGKKFSNQAALWDTFGVSIGNISDKYQKLLDEDKVVDALALSYTTAFEALKKAFKVQKTDAAPIIRLFKSINNHATLGENIELVQLNRGTFKKFKFGMTDAGMKEVAKKHDFNITMKYSGGALPLPQLNITIDRVPFLTIRCKVDSNKADPYIRNIIEKEKGFNKLYKIN